MFCPQCGNPVSDGSSFCGKCGARLAVPNAAVPAGAQSAGSQGAGVLPVPGPPSAAPAARPSRKKLGIGIAAGALGLLVAAGACFAVYSLFFAPYPLDEEAFPDPFLRSSIIVQVDPDRDGKIGRDEVQNVESLNIEGASVVGGLELFPNLKRLELSGDSLVSVDLTDCEALEELTAAECVNLSAVTLGDKPALRVLELPWCNVSSIDLSGATALQSLDMTGNPLAMLSVESSPNLTDLLVDETLVQSLSVGSNPLLVNLACADDVKLEGLDSTPLHEFWVPIEYSDVYTSDSGNGNSTNVLTGTLDERGNVIEVRNADYEIVRSFTYDEAGNCEYYEEPYDSFELEYNSDGRPSTVTSLDTLAEQVFDYDELGRLSRYEYRSGQTFPRLTTYSYDESGRLSLVRVCTEYTGDASIDEYLDWSLSYSPEGELASVKRTVESEWTRGFDTSACDYSYREDGQVSAMSVQTTYGRIDYEYTYDNGVLTGITTSPEYAEGRISPLAYRGFEYNDAGLLAKWTVRSDEYGYTDQYEVVYKRLLSLSDNPPQYQMLETSEYFPPTPTYSPLEGVDPVSIIEDGIPGLCKPVEFSAELQA